MKNKCLLTAMLLALLCLTQSCSDDNDSPHVQQKVQFALGLRSSGDATGRIQATVPEGAAVLISITSPDGDPVYTHKRLTIFHLGEGYVTEPLLLEPGDYTITDFWVVQDSAEVLFLAPKAGSPLASFVSKPVPFDFSVGTDAVADVPIEVVDADGHIAEDFGYASFSLNIVDVPAGPLFRVSVFIAENERLRLTDAYIRFYPNDPFFPVYEHDLQAEVNTLDLSDMNYEYDVLVSIEKPGYATYRQWMSNEQVRENFSNVPLQVTLAPLAGGTAFELEFTMDVFAPTSSYFTLTTAGSGSLSIDWGDGFAENVSFGEGSRSYSHDYSQLQPRPMRITGDIDHIVGFANHAPLANLQTGVLTSLRSIAIYQGEFNAGMGTYDFTQHPLLESIRFSLGGGNILLPPSHNISQVELYYFGTNTDAFVTNIYNNAVSKNIRNGRFDHSTWGPGTLSPEVVLLLNSLRDDYGWSVSYYE
jgi:hypothetical protein